MRSLRPAFAVGVLALCGVSFFAAYAADVTNERPFGGPFPPKKRGMDRTPKATNCKTPTITCKLQKAQPVGADCSCPGSDGKPIAGKVIEHAN